MKNRTTFKEGDRVFDILHGWGKVTYLYSSDWEKSELDHLVCRVKFDNGKECHYTKYVALKSLSFIEYGFDERFTQERPIDYREYIGKWGKFWNGSSKVVRDTLAEIKDGKYGRVVFNPRVTSIYCDNFEPLTEEQLKVLGLWEK